MSTTRTRKELEDENERLRGIAKEVERLRYLLEEAARVAAGYAETKAQTKKFMEIVG